MSKLNLVSERGFPAPVTDTSQDMEGMEFSLSFLPRDNGISASTPLERQSLRQPTLKARIQYSRYLSRYMVGLQALINYPIARGNAVVNSAPSNIGGGPQRGRPGTMRPPSRFNKALPAPIVPFNPPTYGS